MKRFGSIPFILLSLLISIHAPASTGEFRGPGRPLSLSNPPLDVKHVPTGILYDRVICMSFIEEYEGKATSSPITLNQWRQVYYEMYHASLVVPAWPDIRILRDKARPYIKRGIIPIAIMNFEYNRIPPETFEDGPRGSRQNRAATGESLLEARLFAAAPLKERTFRGVRVAFAFDRDFIFTNDHSPIEEVAVDFDDGFGFRSILFDETRYISYAFPGRKVIRVRASLADGSTLFSRFYFNVESQQTPNPHDTLFVTATLPYQGVHGSGEAYVFLSDSLGALTNPIIVVEGFDLDNSWDWDELYSHLNQENMLETLRAEGFDFVVLNFTDATDYLQRNSYVIVELIQQVQSVISPYATIAVAGASMGGLAGRYALAYMETNALDHRARNLISFDAPHHGANIPLGIQYWVEFFSEQSEEASIMRDRLNRPAARQMLLYHYTMPPGSAGEPDSLRAVLMADFASVGEYPANLRKVAIANGSGFQLGQGFAPGEQIVFYEYYSFLADIIGNVWALPDNTEQTIFYGLIDIILLPDEEMTVTVSGTIPYDNAPGGWRSSMADMDSTEAPYGDIIALHPNHCFIPTISALALDTEDLFYDIAGDPDIMSHTPFDTIYYPVENQDHASINAENAEWFLAEARFGATGAFPGLEVSLKEVVLFQNYPNPFNPVTTISFDLPGKARVNLSIFTIEGKLVRCLLDETLEEGFKKTQWDGKDANGNTMGSGVYFCRLKTGSKTLAKKLVFLK